MQGKENFVWLQLIQLLKFLQNQVLFVSFKSIKTLQVSNEKKQLQLPSLVCRVGSSLPPGKPSPSAGLTHPLFSTALNQGTGP